MYKFVITESLFNSLAEQERAPYNRNKPFYSKMSSDAISAQVFINKIKSEEFKTKLIENYNEAIPDWIFYNYHSDKEQYKQAKNSLDQFIDMSLSDFLGYIIDITLDDLDLIWYELYREPDTEKIPYSYVLGITNDDINKERPDKRVEASISILLKEDYSRKLDKSMLYFDNFVNSQINNDLNISENNITVKIELIEEIDRIDEQENKKDYFTQEAASFNKLKEIIKSEQFLNVYKKILVALVKSRNDGNLTPSEEKNPDIDWERFVFSDALFLTGKQNDRTDIFSLGISTSCERISETEYEVFDILYYPSSEKHTIQLNVKITEDFFQNPSILKIFDVILSFGDRDAFEAENEEEYDIESYGFRRDQDDIDLDIAYNSLLKDKRGNKPPIEESLKKWLNQKWTRVEFKDGKRVYKPCGKNKAQDNPARCKPKKKWASMSNDEIKKDRAKKKRGGRQGKQFVSATKKGKVKANYL